VHAARSGRRAVADRTKGGCHRALKNHSLGRVRTVVIDWPWGRGRIKRAPTGEQVSLVAMRFTTRIPAARRAAIERSV